MYIFDVSNKEDINLIVVENLRNYGIKHRLKKYDSVKNFQRVKRDCYAPRLFKVALATLTTDAVFLNCGAIIEVPALVLDACCCIRENIHVEGIFRKAGSSLRQKEIKAHLEKGGRFLPQHNVIDVANILKMFFRNLPEPLVPYNFHDILLRCLILKDKVVDALLQTCLLLPTPNLNLLAYFMEVLKEISNHSSQNKMDAHNIALIITPSVMPVDQKLSRHCGTRLECHVKVIELLIQHADIIGMVPSCARERVVVVRHSCPSTSHGEHKAEESSPRRGRKKKRSSSLTRVLNGIKKMVGKGSPEVDENVTSVNAPECTPHVKSGKKRRAVDVGGALSSKKRASGSRFADEVKGLFRNPTKKEEATCSSGEPDADRQKWNSLERLWGKVKRHSTSDVVVSKPKELHVSSASYESVNEEASCDSSAGECAVNMKQSHVGDKSEFVTLSKSEFEDIESRLSAIESHIHQEFSHMTPVPSCESPIAHVLSPDIQEAVCTNSVQCEYERTLEQSVKLESTSTDQLARILGRELKIRHSLENKVIRSPSARKIGTIRRRSKEMKAEQAGDVGPRLTRHLSLKEEALCSRRDVGGLLYERTSLRRGRPNTVGTGLPQCSVVRGGANVVCLGSNEENFVFLLSEPTDPKLRQSPFSATKISDRFRRSTSEESRVEGVFGIQDNCSNSERWSEAGRYFVESNDEVNTCRATGRPSVSWLRSANAGVVMSRTKLFDGSSPLPGCSRRNDAALVRGEAHTPRASKPRVTNKSPTCASSKEMKFGSPANTKISQKKIGTPRSLSSGRKDTKRKRSPTKGNLFIDPWTGQAKENINILQDLYDKSLSRQNVPSTFCDERRVLKEKSPLKDSNVITFKHKDVFTREMPNIKKPLLVKSPSCYSKTPQHQIRNLRTHTPLKAVTPISYSPKCFPKVT